MIRPVPPRPLGDSLGDLRERIELLEREVFGERYQPVDRPKESGVLAAAEAALDRFGESMAKVSAHIAATGADVHQEPAKPAPAPRVVTHSIPGVQYRYDATSGWLSQILVECHDDVELVKVPIGSLRVTKVYGGGGGGMK